MKLYIGLGVVIISGLLGMFLDLIIKMDVHCFYWLIGILGGYIGAIILLGEDI